MTTTSPAGLKKGRQPRFKTSPPPIRLDVGLVPDIMIAIRMDELNEAPFDYYVLPAST